MALIERGPVVAVDGPAGAGKSTAARRMAERLAFLYLDSGAMYRALALKALEHGTDLRDEDQLSQLLEKSTIVLLGSGSGVPEVFLDGQKVTTVLRSPEVNASVSLVAGFPRIREELVKRQRMMARAGKIVMDGRDIGTYVLPDADVKFFLTASLEARAQRRLRDLADMGFTERLETLQEAIRHRDNLDSQRAVGPLVQAQDAIRIDTTDMEVERVVDTMLMYYRQRVN